jgi:hypothetical protein
VYQGVSLRVDAWQRLRTYGGQRPGGTSGAYNRSLLPIRARLGPLSGRRDRASDDLPDALVGRFRSSPARAGGLAVFVPAAGAGLPDRYHSHRVEAAVEALAGYPLLPAASGWLSSVLA